MALLRLETGIYQPEALGLFFAEGFVRCGAFADYSAHDPFSIFMEKRSSERPAFLAQGSAND